MTDPLFLANQQGMEFYITLLKKLQTTYRFDLEAHFDQLRPFPSTMGRRAKVALYSAHMCLLCLGDLARYREQQRHGNNYEKARE